MPDEHAALRPPVRPRPRRRPLRVADDLAPALVRRPGRARGRHGLRARDLLPRDRRPLGRADRGGGRSSPPTGPRVLTRFPAEELLVTGKTYVRGADLVEGRVESPTRDGARDGRPRRAARRRRARRLELYRRMLLIRGFEELVQSLFLRGEVYGTTHLYSGQEAVAVGVREHAARRRPRRVHLPRPRPRARARASTRRRCSPSCSAARPASTAAAPAR